MSQSVGVDPSVEAFNRDALEHAGYLYNNQEQLSSRLATTRWWEVLTALNDFKVLSFVDIECGGGYWTIKFYDEWRPSHMVAIDAAPVAIALAVERSGNRPIQFQVADAHHLPVPDDSFDVALLQAVLHHDDAPWDIIREAVRVARKIVVLEPNGNNVGLKLIERVSQYHENHGERSHAPHLLHRWVEDAGGRMVAHKLAGFVPMFCPDWMARSMKALEPVVESTPGIRELGCAIYMFVAVRQST
jgi:ubiquinone/menaquinone biosynthesis C-methylase UbiE